MGSGSPKRIAEACKFADDAGVGFDEIKSAWVQAQRMQAFNDLQEAWKRGSVEEIEVVRWRAEAAGLTPSQLVALEMPKIHSPRKNGKENERRAAGLFEAAGLAQSQ